MKNVNQVYVKNSLEAALTYCDTFGAEVTFAIKNPEGTAYEHCELSVDGKIILARLRCGFHPQNEMGNHDLQLPLNGPCV